MCSCVVDLETILSNISLVTSLVIFMSFYLRCLYLYVCNSYNIPTIISWFYLLFDKKNLRLVTKIPIFFYTPAICSSAVIVVFTYMLRSCSEIHMKTFYVTSIIMIFLTAYIRHITIMTLETNNECSKQKWVFDKLYLFSLLPLMIDTTLYHRFIKIFVDCNFYYQLGYTYALLVFVFFVCLFVDRFIRFLGLITMLIFGMIIALVISMCDTNLVYVLLQSTNNVLSWKAVCNAIIYANLFSIYTCDLFCPCAEFTLINYTHKCGHDIQVNNSKQNFYMLTSILVSILCFIWLMLFLHFYHVASFMQLYVQTKVIYYLVSIVLLSTAVMQMYVMLYFVRSQQSKWYYIIFIFPLFFNFYWTSTISYVTVICYLLSQLATFSFISRYMNQINRRI